MTPKINCLSHLYCLEISLTFVGSALAVCLPHTLDVLSLVADGPFKQQWPLEPDFGAERMENTHTVGPMALYNTIYLYLYSLCVFHFDCCSFFTPRIHEKVVQIALVACYYSMFTHESCKLTKKRILLILGSEYHCGKDQSSQNI